MTKIFLTSDQHFFHKNIINYCNRPFNSVQEMNEVMINKWNEVVGDNDIVIHLGDFAFGNRAKEIRDKLNGIIILIRGNHDRYVKQEDGFIMVEDKIIMGNLILTHRPLQDIPEGFINVFGHIHHNKAWSGECVCVEQTDYKPIELNNIKFRDYRSYTQSPWC